MNRRHISLLVVAATILALLVLAPDVVLIVFAGVLFAVFFHGGGAWISRKTGISHMPSVGLFILAVFAGLVGFFLAFAPAISDQFSQLSQQVPQAWNSVRQQLEATQWGSSLLENASPEGLFSRESGTAALTAVSTTFGALGNTVIILFIGIYGALAPQTYLNGFVALFSPSLRPETRMVMVSAGNALQNWIGAQLISMSVVGILTGLGLWLVGIPLAFLLGFIAALMAFVPNIGPVLAAIPALLLAIPEGSTTVIWASAIYLGVQALESYVITPLVQQEKVSLPPALIISTQLLMGVSFGILGLALATPLTAMIIAITKTGYVKNYLEQEDANPASGEKRS